MATWDTFFTWQARPVQFDFHDIAITAGNDVAFATAIGRCCDLSSGEKVHLDFRLTMGSASTMDGGTSCTNIIRYPLRPKDRSICETASGN